MKPFAILAAVLAVSVTQPVAGEPTTRQISVTGEGQSEAQPDMATITLGVTHQAKTARDAMGAVSAAAAKLLARLAAEGVAPRDVQTQGLSLNPVWSNRTTSTGAPFITGFAASNTVFVRVRDLDRLGEVLDALIQDGANEFRGLRFLVQDPAPLIDAARRAAVADGIAKAQVLAEAAGVSLGPVVSITEHGGRPQPVMMEMASARSAAVPIAQGEVSLETSVNMVFQIGQ